jgi:hypothetical protein
MLDVVAVELAARRQVGGSAPGHEGLVLLPRLQL